MQSANRCLTVAYLVMTREPHLPDQRPRVLIAEDEPFSRKVACGRIAALGATVVEAEDGAAALTLLLQEPFDAAIIDLEMPKLDGFQLLGCIRGHPKLRHLPIIVLSGREDGTSIRRALAAGATSYLQKPLNWTAFGEHIRSVLSLRAQLRTAAQAS